jgi:hypothetical protein
LVRIVVESGYRTIPLGRKSEKSRYYRLAAIYPPPAEGHKLRISEVLNGDSKKPGHMRCPQVEIGVRQRTGCPLAKRAGFTSKSELRPLVAGDTAASRKTVNG